MEYKITQGQNERFIQTIQRFIDSEMEVLKNLSEEEELSYDESHQVDSIDHIKVVDVEKKQRWVINVDIYVNSNTSFFEDVLYHLRYELRKYIGFNSVNERNVIEIRKFGPGIDF
jgi:transcriptional regulator of heat shock response